MIIPTLNEEQAIGDVVERFPESYRDNTVNIYVVDGGSTDDTVRIAREHQAEVIQQRLNGGKGDGVRQAFNEVESDYYVMIDGDGSYRPEELGEILDPLLDGEAEHVIGRRREKDPDAIPRLNKAGNRLFNGVTRLTTGAEIHDMLSGYRGLTDYSLDYIEFTRPGFGIETEMTFTAIENNLPIVEVDIEYLRRKGESNLDPLSDGWRIFKTIVWSIRDMNPLKFFSIASLIFFLLSVYPLWLTVSQYLRYDEIRDTAPGLLAGILVIIGVQFLVFGMLADQVKTLEKRNRDSGGLQS